MMADDILSFQDPENLLGKQFILSPDTEASGLFEVIAYCKGKDTSAICAISCDLFGPFCLFTR